MPITGGPVRARTSAFSGPLDMPLPPVLAAGALYDELLQSALKQFFPRATLETESVQSESSLGRLDIEPTADPAVLTIRWFGSRHTIRVPGNLPFTAHEVYLARAVGSVLGARYRAIFDPRLMAERGELFRGLIEDRYVGAFLDGGAYHIESPQSLADRVALAIEVLRIAALSTYENRAISSGVLLLDSDHDPCERAGPTVHGSATGYSRTLTQIKSFYRLCDGLQTVFLVNRQAMLLDIVDIARWSSMLRQDMPMAAPCAHAYRPHARATLDTRNVCVVLSPSHEIKVFAQGAQVFTFRGASWHLLDLEAKYRRWRQAVGDGPLAERLFQATLDLADHRQGALFVVLRNPQQDVPHLIASLDRLDENVEPVVAADQRRASRRDLQYLLRNRTVTELDSRVLEALASVDGATVTDTTGRLLAFGAILLHRPAKDHGWAVEGARTAAAATAARFGPVLKVSEDGIISFYDGDKVWDI